MSSVDGYTITGPWTTQMMEVLVMTRSEANAKWLREHYDVHRHYPHLMDIIEYAGKRWMVHSWWHSAIVFVYLISWEGKTLEDAKIAVTLREDGIRRMGSLPFERYSGWLVNDHATVLARFEDDYAPITPYPTGGGDRRRK